MKLFILLILSIGFALCCNAQNSILTSDVLIKVSVGWKEDSLACKGYRKSVAQSVLNSKIDSVSKDFLVLQFGQPRRI